MLQNEIALVVSSAGAIVTAVLVLLVSFGVPITHDQAAAISALVALIVPIAAGLVIRSQVVPTSSLPRSM